MNEIKRDTLGAIWRLLSQMEYAAENGYTDTLKAQFTTLMKQMARLEMIEKNVLAARGF
jgi:hypothetical protein